MSFHTFHSRVILSRCITHLFVWVCFLLILAGCSSNAGVLGGSGSWQASGLQDQHIHILAVNTDDTKMIYAGDAQGTVFVSSDAALHWSEHSTGLPVPVELHALLFDSGTKQLFAATDKGIFINDSKAQQWTPVKAASLPTDSYTALEFNISAPKTLYAGTVHNGIFMSHDDGMSWSALKAGWPVGSAANDLSYDADHHQLWAATTAGVYLLKDGAPSWQASSTGLPAHTVAYAIEPAATSSASLKTVYLGTNHGVYTSQDQGRHWRTGQESLAATSVYQIVVDFRSNNGQTIYISTDVGAFRSDDSGQHWAGIASGLPRAHPVYALALGADNYTQLFAAADGVYQYPGSGSGLSFSRIITILVVLLFFFLLYRLTQYNRNRKRPAPFPRSPVPAEPRDESHTDMKSM